MTTMNISLPIELKNFIDRKVKNERYGTSSEYIRYLLREEEKLSAENELRHELMLGAMGPFTKIDEDYFDNIISQIKVRKHKSKTD